MKYISQVSEAGAFITLMEEKLKPALKYIFWIDTKNHLELTRLNLYILTKDIMIYGRA